MQYGSIPTDYAGIRFRSRLEKAVQYKPGVVLYRNPLLDDVKALIAAEERKEES